jgi:hypothetical protein
MNNEKENNRNDIFIEKQEGTVIIGDNAIGTINNYNHPGEINFAQLIKELEQLQQSLNQQEDKEEVRSLITKVSYAREAAIKNDSKSVVKHIQTIGSVGLKFAKDLGLNIIANIISNSL